MKPFYNPLDPIDRFEPGVSLDAALLVRDRLVEPFRRRKPTTVAPVMTVQFAPRPFCCECGCRDFWQLPNGRWMCCRCRPRRVSMETEGA